MKFEPRPYQEYAIQRIIDKRKLCLMLDMGMGKTVVTLTAIQRLINADRVHKVLVIAPLHVAETTWLEETDKWDHLTLKVVPVLGTLLKRLKALDTDADVYVINRENVCWIAEYMGAEQIFDMLVIDESSSFKNSSSKRFTYLKKFEFNRVVELTGTPAPNSLMDLWSQMYLLDRGERLGKRIGLYRNKYFTPGASNGYFVYKWNLKENAEKVIYRKISDLCVSMKSEDYLTLPPIMNNVVKVKLVPYVLKAYEVFKRNLITEFKGEELTAASAAVLANKLMQFANGAVYNDAGKVVEVHNRKLDALAELADTSNILVFYQFKHDLERITDRFPDAVILRDADDIKRWNEGSIKMMLAHPASAGHGLNLQFGGNIIVWFGLTWSLELYRQANKRLHRPGQVKPVVINHLATEGTIDEVILKVLSNKDACQNDLLTAMKGLIKYE